MKYPLLTIIFLLVINSNKSNAQILTSSETITNASCTNPTGGLITVTALGGIPPYQYSLDGIVFQNSNLFSGLSSGIKSLTIKDAGGTSTTNNLVTNGSFTLGNTGFTSDYQFITNAGVGGVQKAYGINTAANNWFQYFPACTDHTSPPNGNFMIVDGSTSNSGNDKVWEQTINVLPNQIYTFSYWLQTIATPNLALIDVAINGTIIGSATAPATTCSWVQYTYTWNSGTNTMATIAIYDRLTIQNGNDFGLDDISFVGPSVTAVQSITKPITIGLDSNLVLNTNPRDTAVCIGTVLNLIATSNEGASLKWSYNTALSDSTINNPSAIINTYSNFLVTSSLNGCTKSKTIKVDTLSIPIINAGPDKYVLAGSSVQLDASIINPLDYTFTWFPNSYLSADNILNPLTTPNVNIKYTLTAENNTTFCSASDTMMVYTFDKIIVPNVFSPNGDGVHDNWEIKAIGAYPNLIVEVYNRGGNLIFKSDKGYPKAWDGTYNGKPIPVGTYYYIINLYNGTTALSGTITILK
jgi:gliding motility-associated-like protein